MSEALKAAIAEDGFLADIMDELPATYRGSGASWPRRGPGLARNEIGGLRPHPPGPWAPDPWPIGLCA